VPGAETQVSAPDQVHPTLRPSTRSGRIQPGRGDQRFDGSARTLYTTPCAQREAAAAAYGAKAAERAGTARDYKYAAGLTMTMARRLQTADALRALGQFRPESDVLAPALGSRVGVAAPP
jgi:hypothetical protein